MKLNEKIYQCRRKAGLSQEALAERIGVSRQAISKWETGEASPEISKLPLLARTFGVTADWLLSEEDEETDGIPQEEPPVQQTASPSQGHPYAQSGQHSAAVYPDWVDKLPGFLGRMLKKYGWIFGVRIAVSGALFTVMGFVGKAMFNALTVTSLHSTTSVTAYDNAGNIIDLGKYGLSASDFGGAGGPLSSSVSMVSRMPKPADILLNFIIGIGLVLLIGGAALAWYLKKKGSES